MANVTRRQLERYPRYLKLLILLRNNGEVTVSSALIAKVMNCSEEQVRKDLQLISKNEGKPGVGRYIEDTIQDLQDFLGYSVIDNAVVVGVGRLGEAFLNYTGFTDYGFNIIAGFDVDKNKINTMVHGKPVYDLLDIDEKVKELNVDLAILTVPANVAQSVVNMLVKAGIKGILNFASVHLETGDAVVVENIDMAASLAMVSHNVKKHFPESR